MKKFSKLILETKKTIWTKHPLVNPVDWDEIFKPLIEHIDSNLKDNTPPPSEGIFSNRTKSALDQLIDAITEDYGEYYVNNIDDGSEESFFNAYSINTNQQDILDCLQQLSDRTDDINSYPDWDMGYYAIDFNKAKYKGLDELIEDIEDVHLKLKMLKVNYAIIISALSFDVCLLDSTKNISKEIKSNAVGVSSTGEERLFKDMKINIFIFNSKTVQTDDFE